jgi:serine protease Do
MKRPVLLPSISGIWLFAAAVLAAPPADLASREEQAFRAAAEAVAPSVVAIETIGGLDTVGEVLVGTGPSSGVIVSDDGYIVSSTFNFAHRPASIIVNLPDGSRHPARLVARDEARKLVLLKIDGVTNLRTPIAAPERDAKVGHWTVAVGRTFDAKSPNISVGILSAVHRIWGRALQTDAKISAANYGGALVDLQGRLMGVLVPLSPDHRDDVSGAEWYDSGIGFAVSYEHIQSILPRLKAGETLKPGIVGIHFKGPNVYADPTVVLKCRAGSPAYEAGIRAGDRITAVGGRAVEYQSHVMEELHRRYAGDAVKFTVARGKETFERELKLVEKLEPYRRPFLGLIAERTAEPGDDATVRYVFENSPAAKAGLAVGDVIVKFNDADVHSRDELRTAVADALLDKEAKLTYRRAGDAKTVALQPIAEPETIPPQSKDAAKKTDEESTDKLDAKPLKIKIAELPNVGELYVPDDYDDAVPHGLVVLVHPNGGFTHNTIVERWRDRCGAAGLLLLVPKSAKENWARDDLEFIKKAIDRTAESYRVDAARVVAVGYEEGGMVAVQGAAALRDRIRGIAVVNAVPAGFNGENEPLYPTSFIVATSHDFGNEARVEKSVATLRERHFPVFVRSLGKKADDWDAAGADELLRWIDALDRI